MNQRREIMLQKTTAGILAHNFHQGRPDAEVVDLFGTHIIPTAFTAAADMDHVMREIKRLNPGHVVSILGRV
jgi:hypothetical protein